MRSNPSVKLKPFKLFAIAICITFLATLSLTGCSESPTETKKDSVNLGLVLAPSNLDIRQTSGAALEQILLDNVYEPLMTFDDNLQVINGVSENTEVSDDALEYTFTIPSNLKFADGSSVKPNDFKRSIEQVKDEKLVGYKELKDVEEIQADDQNSTLTIKLNEPNSQFLFAMAGRAGVAVENVSLDSFKTETHGTGPFIVKSFDGSSKLELVKNENYWNSQKAAKLNSITVNYISDSTAGLNAIKAGDIDILAPINEKLSESIKSNDSFKFEIGKGSDKFELAMNNKADNLKNKEVRQAIRYAINHSDLVASRGSADAILGGPITELEPGFEDLTDLYQYNPEKSTELLESAGFSKANPLKLSLAYPAAVYGDQLGQILSSQLKEVGIELDVTSVDFATWLEKVYKNKDYDLTIVDNNEPNRFFNWTNPDYYYQFDNSEVQSLYKQAVASKTKTEANEFLAKAARIVSNEAAADWLFNYRTTVVLKKNIQGFRANMNQARLPLANLEFK